MKEAANDPTPEPMSLDMPQKGEAGVCAAEVKRGRAAVHLSGKSVARFWPGIWPARPKNPRDRVRERSNFVSRCKRFPSFSSLLQKFLFRFSENHDCLALSRLRKRGVSPSSRT
jgi:hypothetical protein